MFDYRMVVIKGWDLHHRIFFCSFVCENTAIFKWLVFELGVYKFKGL